MGMKRALAAWLALALALPPLPAAARIDTPAAEVPAARLLTDFGAVCDGTTDDSAALAAAATWLAGASNRTLMIPNATCLVTQTTTLTAGGTIAGYGPGSVLSDGRTTGDTLAIATTAAVTLRDFMITSPSYKTSGACVSVAGTGGSTINQFSRIKIRCTNAYDGIRLDEAQNLTVESGTDLQDFAHDGILKINSQNPDGGQDHYLGVTLQNLNRTLSGTEASNPFSTVNASATVTVTHSTSGLSAGMVAIWAGASTFNNVTISGNYTIQSIVDSGHFTITAGTTANATGSGGGTPTYRYVPNAAFEYQAGGDVEFLGSKLIGACWGFLDNATYGPTGTMVVVGNSLEQSGCAAVGAIQTTSGVEHANLIVNGNELSNLTAGSATWPVFGEVYIGTGTPTTSPKWLHNITITGNTINDASGVAGSAITVLDGTGVTIADNTLYNGGIAGPTAIAVSTNAANVREYGNSIVNFPTGNYGTMTPGAFGTYRVHMQTGAAADNGGVNFSSNSDGSADSGLVFGYNTSNHRSWLYSHSQGISSRGIDIFTAGATTPALTLDSIGNVIFGVANVEIDTKSHLRGLGTAPALSSCGTSPAISGSDIAGLVTMGTGTPTSCTITFNQAYTSAPYCTVSWLINIASMQYAVTNAAITLTQTATSSNKVTYHCVAQSGG